MTDESVAGKGLKGDVPQVCQYWPAQVLVLFWPPRGTNKKDKKDNWSLVSINTSIKMVNKYDDRKTKNDIETNKDTELLNEASTLSDGDTEDQSTELVDDNKMCQKYFLDKSAEYEENNFENFR